MTVNNRMSAFINSFDLPGDAYLDAVEVEAKNDHIPIIRHEMISFLQVLLRMKKPQRILEVGTATGFSALVMAAASQENCQITTIERDLARLAKARDNIANAPAYGKKITTLEGDAADILASLEGPYDFVFMDAAKGQYIHFLKEIKRLLAPEGILLSDNILQEGDILESHYIIERRNRTIYKRMREYLDALKKDPQFLTSIIPIGDGAAISVLKTAGLDE